MAFYRCLHYALKCIECVCALPNIKNNSKSEELAISFFIMFEFHLVLGNSRQLACASLGYIHNWTVK